MKILFISSRNIYNSTGEIRLIKNRANTLHNNYGIVFDFICYRNKEVLNADQEIINEESKFFLYTFSKSNPISTVFGNGCVLKKAKELINKNDYMAIVVSGELVLNLVDKIRKLTTVPVIYDIHGVCDELKEFNGENFLATAKKRGIYYLYRYLEKRYIRKFDGAFAVTEELRQHTIDDFGGDKLKYFIVPCAKPKEQLNISLIKKHREKYRKKYNIKDNELLFIYSGGVSPWQCIEETIDLFTRIQKELGNCKLLLLSNDINKIDTSDNLSILKDSVSFDEVDKTLCAGDFAFMLRGNCVTNHVAFPNKYCEYLSSGMKTISTPYLHTIKKNIENNNVGFIFEENKFSELITYIKNNKSWGNDFEVRQKVLDEMSFDNTLKSFAEFLKLL